MKRDDVLAFLAAHKDAIAEFGAKRIAVFGSFARDEARSDSDIDILVDFESPATFKRYMGLKFYLEDRLHRKVDLVPWDGLRPLTRDNVEKEAIHVP